MRAFHLKESTIFTPAWTCIATWGMSLSHTDLTALLSTSLRFQSDNKNPKLFECWKTIRKLNGTSFHDWNCDMMTLIPSYTVLVCLENIWAMVCSLVKHSGAQISMTMVRPNEPNNLLPKCIKKVWLGLCRTKLGPRYWRHVFWLTIWKHELTNFTLHCERFLFSTKNTGKNT